MPNYSLSHLADSTLLQELRALVTRDRATTAELLAHIAEVDARRLYLPAAHSSMFSYCVHELRMSEDAAYKRIRAGRAARRFPAIFTVVAEGRLHLTAVVLLAPYLNPENCDELLAAAGHKTKAEIELLIAQRFPRPDLATRVEPASSPPVIAPLTGQLVPEPVEQSDRPGRIGVFGPQLVPEPVVSPPQRGREASDPRPRVAPLAPQRFALQVTVSQVTYDKLRHAQALLGHQIPSGDVAEALDRALDALIRELEKRKFAATSRPRPHAGARSRQSSTNPRHIPADVKRAVWERDGGRCTFVSGTGNRCAARTRLEYDHVDPVARGGTATLTGLRLRCRAHNQYEAERTFGVEFMRHKREQTRIART